MSEITFTDKLSVELWQTWGTDKNVPDTARVSSRGLELLNDDDYEVTLSDGDVSLIEMLASNGHTSPFEHMGASFRLHVPIFVMREWMRHRTQSYNEESGRWKVLSPVFYVPNRERPTKQIGRTGEYQFILDGLTRSIASESIRKANDAAWIEYDWMLSENVAKEVARMVLPVNIYTSVIVSANFLNWIKFLKLRATEQAMYEIRQCAFQVRDALTTQFPVSMESWGY
jgi:thymidylate synthase (FAD)